MGSNLVNALQLENLEQQPESIINLNRSDLKKQPDLQKIIELKVLLLIIMFCQFMIILHYLLFF